MQRYEDSDDEEVTAKPISKGKPKKRNSKKRRRRVYDLDPTLKRAATLDAVTALRASSVKAPAPNGIDDEEDDDTALQASLRAARKRMRQLQENAKTRLETLVKPENEKNSKQRDGNEVNDDLHDLPDVGGLDELEEFARNLEVDAGDADKVAEEVAAFAEQEALAVAVKEAGDGPVEFAAMERQDDFGDAGVAAALARYRTMGELGRESRVEQHGRALDKRTKSNVDGADEDGIRLNYTDEAGRDLTPKEAFRLMCHKFHGKGPGKNKRETRLRQTLRTRRLKEMAVDDTPLGAVSALRSETERTGVAHVVLSGNTAGTSNAIGDVLSKARRR